MQHYEDEKSVSIATLRSRAKNLKRFLPLHMPVMALDQKMLITGHKSRSVFDKFYSVIEAKDVFTAIHNSKKVIESKSDNELPINKKVDAYNK